MAQQVGTQEGLYRRTELLREPGEILREGRHVPHLETAAEAQRHPRRLRTRARIEHQLGRSSGHEREHRFTVDLNRNNVERRASGGDTRHLDRDKRALGRTRIEWFAPRAAVRKCTYRLRPAVIDLGIAQELVELFSRAIDIATVPMRAAAKRRRLRAGDSLQ